MSQRKRTPQIQSNYLKLNPEYHLIYFNLLKEAKSWNNCSQYWLGKEATRRAGCLLRGDIDGYEKAKYSHELHYPGVVMNMN